MKAMLQLVGLLAATYALAVPSAWAQPCCGGPGMSRYYNSSTEMTITGKIDEVQQVPGGWMGGGTHISVKTEAGRIDVHLGPTTFVANAGFTFAKGDTVEILGSKVKVGDVDALMAREITKEGKTLTLRDGMGRPMWARRGR